MWFGVHVGHFHCLAYLEFATVLLFKTHDELEERGLLKLRWVLSRRLCRLGEAKVEVGEEGLVAVGLGKVFGFYHLVAEARAVGDEYLQLLLSLLRSSLRSRS